MGGIIGLIGAILAGQGIWTVVLYLMQRHDKTKYEKIADNSHQSKMLLGLGHDRIVYLGTEYIKRGSITEAEFENLSKYLFEPYKALGGNGTVDKIMHDVKRLPIRKEE